MVNKPLPENISHASLNDARKELDEKLNQTRRELDGKIGEKLSTYIFCTVIGLLVVVLIAVISSLFSQIASLKDDKIATLQSRVTVLETKNNSQPNPPK